MKRIEDDKYVFPQELLQVVSTDIAGRVIEVRFHNLLAAYIAGLREFNLSDDDLRELIRKKSAEIGDSITLDLLRREADRVQPLAKLILPITADPTRLRSCQYVYSYEKAVANIGRVLPAITMDEITATIDYLADQHRALCPNPSWHADD